MQHLLHVKSWQEKRSGKPMPWNSSIQDAAPMEYFVLPEGNIEILAHRISFMPESEADVALRYADGSAAALAFSSGSGRIFLTGFLPGLSYMRKAQVGHLKYPFTIDYHGAQLSTWAPRWWPDFERDLITKFALDSGVSRPVELSSPVVETTELVSSAGVLIPLVNYSFNRIPDLKARIHGIPRDRSFSLTSFEGNRLQYKRDGDILEVTLPLGYMDILTLKWK